MNNSLFERHAFLSGIIDHLHKGPEETGVFLPTRYKNCGDGSWEGPREERFYSLAEIYAHENNIHIHEAIQQVVSFFDHNPECFGDMPPAGNKLKLSPEVFAWDMRERIPLEFHSGKTYFRCFHAHTLTAPNGKTGGYIVIYSMTDKKFVTVAFHIKPYGGAPYTKFKVKLGTTKIHLRLVGEDKLRRYPQAAVLLFEDPVIAACVEKMFDSSNGLIRREDYVISTWFGGSDMASFINPGALLGRNVYFIPKAFDKNFSRAHEYKATLGAGVEKWFICVLPLVFEDLVYSQLRSEWGEEDAYSGRAAVFLRDHSIIPAIVRNSLSVEDYADWQKDIGLCADTPAAGNRPRLSRRVQEIVAMQKKSAHTLESMSSDVFSSGNITVILGHSDSGKSTVSLHLLAALDQRLGIFCFRPGRRTYTSLLYDAETSGALFNRRFARLEQALPDADLGAWPLHVALQRESSEPAIDLTNKEHRQRLEREIQTIGPDLVCFDSLSALCAKSKLHAHWLTLLQWFVYLERMYGVAIIICHHTNKSGDVSGSSQIEDFAQNLLRIEDPRRPGVKLPDGEMQAFAPYMQSTGALFKLTVQKCKLLPELTSRSSGYYLPETPEKGNLGWMTVPLDGATGAESETDPAGLSLLQQLPPDLNERELKVMDYAFRHSEFQRADIDALLAVERSVSGEVLLSLKKTGLLKMEQRGNNYTYSAVTPVTG